MTDNEALARCRRQWMKAKRLMRLNSNLSFVAAKSAAFRSLFSHKYIGYVRNECFACQVDAKAGVRNDRCGKNCLIDWGHGAGCMTGDAAYNNNDIDGMIKAIDRSIKRHDATPHKVQHVPA